jgi:hypothetical protein
MKGIGHNLTGDKKMIPTLAQLNYQTDARLLQARIDRTEARLACARPSEREALSACIKTDRKHLARLDKVLLKQGLSR